MNDESKNELHVINKGILYIDEDDENEKVVNTAEIIKKIKNAKPVQRINGVIVSDDETVKSKSVANEANTFFVTENIPKNDVKQKEAPKTSDANHQEKKYEITSIAMRVTAQGRGFVGYRIRALKDFGDIRKGDIGGCVQRETNLSQKGNSWIYPGAIAAGFSRVEGDAVVSEGSVIFDRAKIYGNARVSGPNTAIGGKCEVYGNALVTTSSVMDKSKIYGHAIVENSDILGSTYVYENAVVHNAWAEDEVIRGDAIFFERMIAPNGYTFQPEPDEIEW